MLSMARQTKSRFLTWRLEINYTCTQSSISANEHLYGKRKITHLYHCKKCQLYLYFKHVDQQVFIDSAKKKNKKKIHSNLLKWIYVFFLNVVHISCRPGLTLIVKEFLLEPDLMPSMGFEFLFVSFSSMINVKKTQFCYSCKLIHLYNDHVSNLNTLNVWNDEVHKQNVRPRNQHWNMIFIKLTLSNHWLNLLKIRWTTNQWPKQRINYIFCIVSVLH